MNKLARFMEHFWLAVAIGTGLVAIWMTVLEPGREALQWWVFPLIALAMFFFRRFTRRRLEAMEERRRNS
ncbi:MAG: hypothetical protein MUE88_08305 [Flavobacteriales bacterium]|jgi:MYXO-CTERM domain-containing protein|nr:hypothetical protein [Flavobacteriales bacterium]